MSPGINTGCPVFAYWGFDGSAIGLGTRSKRYAMVVDDGVVTVLHTEDSPGVAEVSTAEAILQEV